MAKKKQPGLMPRVAAAVATFAFVIAALAALITVLHYRSWRTTPLLGDEDAVTLVIPEATPWDGVLDILEKNGLVTNELYFEYWARDRGLPAKVKAGSYLFEGSLDLGGLAKALEQGGAVEEVALTVPEGFTIFHIADRVERLGLASRDDFLDAARDPEALQTAGIGGESFEGYLFPDTYRFVKGTPAHLIIERLHERWRTLWDELAQKHADDMRAIEDTYAFDRHAFITMASIIEKETGAHGERSKVARVFYNRIDRDMKLQTDPTCVYGESTYREIPHPRYCKDPLNRYSTYVIDGLPPGPISNPGKASMKAALTPDTSPEARAYLFFVARRDGSAGHHFSKTYREHKAAIRKFLKR